MEGNTYSEQKSNIDKPPVTEPPYVATGTGFLLGLWRPGQILSSDVPKALRDRVSLTSSDYGSLIFITVAGLAARLWDISNPPIPLHEELIIGKKINDYITGRFFFDSQPPLVGMIYAYLAVLFKYPGQFDFGKFDTYNGHVFPYMELRSVTALMGVAMVILTFLTLKLTGMARRGATVGAIFVAFECSFAVEQRFIFQLPIALFMLASVIYLWKQFELQQPFSLKWHLFAVLIGLNLGTLVSSRNEGWWTVVWIFLASSYQLWWSFGNIHQKHPIMRFLFNGGLRIFYFYLIPLMFSVLALSVHIQLLPGTGEGTPAVTGPFQETFINNPNSEVVSPVGIGSLISLRHLKTNNYLHSHDAFYYGGSRQQHVTGYGYRDLNNIWFVENVSSSALNPHSHPFSVISNGAYLKLRHFQSLRRLHTHNYRAPVTDNDYQFEVSAYGADGYPGDLNDVWQLEIVQEESAPAIAKSEWRALNSIVRLKHPLRDCYLFSHRVKLPQNAFAQQEITCAKNGIDENSYWFVEVNYHPMHPEGSDKVKFRKLNIMEKVEEYSDLMAVTNEMLEKDSGNRYSHHGIWLPFMQHGITLYRQHHRQVVIVGNMVVWYASVIGLGSYALFKIYTFLSLQRGWMKFTDFHGIREMDHHVGGFVLLWACHFAPLMFKERCTLPEYLPALYCSILASSRWLEYFSSLVLRKPKLINIFYGVLIAGTISTFIFYSPFVYGSKLLIGQCRALEFGGLWDLSCNSYLESESLYAAYDNSHVNIVYEYQAPPAAELESATLITTMDRANPTGFSFRADSPIILDADKPEIRRFMRKYEKLGAAKKNYVDLVNEDDKDGDVIAIAAPSAETPSKVDEDDEDDDDEELDHEVESKLLVQWARITDPPSLTVDSAVAKSAKERIAEKSLAQESLKSQDASTNQSENPDNNLENPAEHSTEESN